jgi:hypothetical protein
LDLLDAAALCGCCVDGGLQVGGPDCCCDRDRDTYGSGRDGCDCAYSRALGNDTCRYRDTYGSGCDAYIYTYTYGSGRDCDRSASRGWWADRV